MVERLDFAARLLVFNKGPSKLKARSMQVRILNTGMKGEALTMMLLEGETQVSLDIGKYFRHQGRKIV